MASYRSTYHHGDARAALIRAALDLARRGGPRMVTLRAAAREVGITATAVYRHFATADELLEAVRVRALRMLADRVDAAALRAAAAGADLPRAAAEGYLAFARECPGLFAMACHGGADAVRDLMADRLAPSAGGAPEPPHRPEAGTALWSVVHGVALLAVDGSPRALPEGGSRAGLGQVLDIVLAGLDHPAAPAVPITPAPNAVPAGPVAGAGPAVRTRRDVADTA